MHREWGGGGGGGGEVAEVAPNTYILIYLHYVGGLQRWHSQLAIE